MSPATTVLEKQDDQGYIVPDTLGPSICVVAVAVSDPVARRSNVKAKVEVRCICALQYCSLGGGDACENRGCSLPDAKTVGG